VDILELLAQQGEDHWLPWQQKRPLLHIACERGAWNCVKYLVSGTKNIKKKHFKNIFFVLNFYIYIYIYVFIFSKNHFYFYPPLPPPLFWKIIFCPQKF